jgi:hypothetical protein
LKTAKSPALPTSMLPVLVADADLLGRVDGDRLERLVLGQPPYFTTFAASW